jgi:hypothetical protein
MELEFSRHIVGKDSNMKSHENPSFGGQVLCGWTDGRTEKHTYDDANSRFSQFCERA